MELTEQYKTPRPCGNGLMLDYSNAGNHPYDPTSAVRDAIVSVNKDSADLLLGWMYLDLAIAQIPTPSFFTLERIGPLDHYIEHPYPTH